ncbi:hypothetical protein N8I77_007636 [Diaporthe amygdali]|uniref:Zn(2)-C6 fungal-type domain-containing protein n=1 Tax=Phomopsis amygdali TaxID=1214568 RepID=A0AAD9W248_PHOAM|nr:hypothetical protein N8I77_007636 [Diaporthe amygdali]
MTEQHESPNIDDLTPEEASRIIHSHRKVRYGTACWPCRQRKVKCDNKQPCENCVKREHPQLCSYKPNRSSKSTGGSDVASHISKKRAHSPDDQDSRELSSDAKSDPAMRAFGIPFRSKRKDSSSLTPISVDPESAEVTRYLGQNSIPALLREQTSPNDRQAGVDNIRQDMRSIFGLDNSAPFPLMSSRHLEKLTADISAELPSDREVMKLFRTYKEIPQVFWGFVIDIDDLESRLMVYLEERAKNARSTVKIARRPVSASWLAILFAVLAVGSQYHDSPYHIRTSSSQRYLQISFHFLRMGNFLLRPNFDSIQALLLVSFSLLNDMKAEGSWALLGLTCRLALSLGLHRLNNNELTDPEAKRKEIIRRKLWWCCVWHDTLTSLSFDRMFLAMHQLSVIPTRSWAFTYHGLSSAVLLGLLPETKSDPEIRQLQGDLISALSATAAKEQSSPVPHIQKSDKDIELSGPLSRALAALKNIYDHGSVMGSSVFKRDGGTRSGTRTPLGMGQLTNPSAGASDGQNLLPGATYAASSLQSLDPHQDAAMAMAEMQNGTGMQDFSGLPYVTGAPSLEGTDLAPIDSSAYIEPMELYDSIFWESPDPWNSGLDTMNFDFLAQPPPGQPPQQQFYF